jgi:hypothetical protein
MPYLDMTAANAALKELYGPQTIQTMAYTDNPWFAMVSKDENCGGKYIPYPTIWSASQGRSSTFANAQANQTAPKLADFLLTLKPDYGFATISNQLLEAGASDREAFLRPAKLNIDSAIRTLTNSIASALFRSGTGSIGKVNASGLSTGVITLNDPETVVQFERDMTLVASSTDGGGTDRAGIGYVIAVNRVSGTVTVASSGLGGAAATPSGWAANDFIYVQGDKNAKPTGLTGWLPSSAPAAGDNFFGVDRSVDTRLYGVSFDGSAYNIEEALIEHSKFLAREQAKTKVCITNFTSYAALDKALGAKREYVSVSVGEISFKGITVNGHKGPIDVFPDRNCPGLTEFMLDPSTWKMLSTNEVPHISRADGLDMLRVANADALEVRLVAYYQLACNAPGWNGQGTLGA